MTRLNQLMAKVLQNSVSFTESLGHLKEYLDQTSSSVPAPLLSPTSQTMEQPDAPFWDESFGNTQWVTDS
jgi:hypothetical protein